MDFKDVLHRNVANFKSKLPQISHMPKFPKLRSRKIFSARNSKENVSTMEQPPLPPSSIVDRSPARISTISSLVEDSHTGHRNNDYFVSGQYSGASATSVNNRNGNDTDNEGKPSNLRFSEKLTKTYKELSEFKFSHIFGKKTIVRTTQIQVDMYKQSYEEERNRRQSEQSQFDIRIVELPTMASPLPSPILNTTQSHLQLSANQLNLPTKSSSAFNISNVSETQQRIRSPTFISYPAPQNSDEIEIISTPPLSRRKKIPSEENIQPNKSALWSIKTKKNYNSNNSIDSEKESPKISNPPRTGSHKSSGMWKLQRPIRIKASLDELDQNKIETKHSMANILKKFSSKDSVDEEKSHRSSGMWKVQRPIRIKLDPEEIRRVESGEEPLPRDTYDIKTKVIDMVDRSSVRVKTLITKNCQTENVPPCERSPGNMKSKEEIDEMGYGKKNLKYIEMWKVRRRREIRRTKPFPLNKSDDQIKSERTPVKRNQGMWKLQRPIRIKLDETRKQESILDNPQVEQFKKAVSKVLKLKKFTRKAPNNKSVKNIKKQDILNKRESDANFNVIEGVLDDLEDQYPQKRIKTNSELLQTIQINEIKILRNDGNFQHSDVAFENESDDYVFEREPELNNKRLWKPSNAYPSSDSEEEAITTPGFLRHTANDHVDIIESEPTIIILNRPPSILHFTPKSNLPPTPSPSSPIPPQPLPFNLALPIPLQMPTPPPPHKFSSLLSTSQIDAQSSHISTINSSISLEINSDINENSSSNAKHGHKRNISVDINDKDMWTVSDSFGRRRCSSTLNCLDENLELSRHKTLDDLQNDQSPLKKWNSIDIFNDDVPKKVFEDFDDILKNVPIIPIETEIDTIPEISLSSDGGECKSLEYLSLHDESLKYINHVDQLETEVQVQEIEKIADAEKLEDQNLKHSESYDIEVDNRKIIINDSIILQTDKLENEKESKNDSIENEVTQINKHPDVLLIEEKLHYQTSEELQSEDIDSVIENSNYCVPIILSSPEKHLKNDVILPETTNEKLKYPSLPESPPPLPLDLPPPLPLNLPPPIPLELFSAIDIPQIPIPVRSYEIVNQHLEETEISLMDSTSYVIPEPTGIPVEKRKVSKPLVKTESLRRQFSDEKEAKNLKKFNVNKLISRFEHSQDQETSKKCCTKNIDANVIIKEMKYTEDNGTHADLHKTVQDDTIGTSNRNSNTQENEKLKKLAPDRPKIDKLVPPPVNPRKKLNSRHSIKSPDKEIFYSFDDDTQIYSLGGRSIVKELYTIDL